MKTIFLLAITLLVTFSGNAQTNPNAPDAAELTKMLNEFLSGASRNDAAMHDRFWAEDVIYTGSQGRRRGKTEIMKDVRSVPAPKPGDPVTVYTAEDIRIQQYGDTAIVAFRLVSTTTKDESKEVANNLNSGTFVKRNGKWQVVNWQSTRVPPPPEARPQPPFETAEPSVTLPAELSRVLTDYETGWKAGDAAALAKLFAEDGYVLSQGRGPVKGRAAIQKLYTRNGSALSLRAIAYAVEGNVGYIIGGYSGELGKPDDGKFTLTLRKENGRWMIVSDMDNSNRRAQ
jgi:uncharacterized protein (TIGR02246 family)